MLGDVGQARALSEAAAACADESAHVPTEALIRHFKALIEICRAYARLTPAKTFADAKIPSYPAEITSLSGTGGTTAARAGIRTSDLRSAGTRALQIVVRDVALGTPEALATRTTLEQALG